MKAVFRSIEKAASSKEHHNRPYRNAVVSLRRRFSVEERFAALEKAGLNVFQYPASMIDGCDLLSDSGTGAMTTDQWAELMRGDESYGSNEGYFMLKEQIARTFGREWKQTNPNMENVFIFHQGRAAENALFSQLGKLGEDLVIPSNGHFDTTHANIEASGMRPVNLFSPELKDSSSGALFKGNMDVAALKKLLREKKEKVPLVYLTITNNTGGGQPVSMENIREVSSIARKNSIPLFFDACRFAENAYFIRKREPGYSQKSVAEIVREMFSYADGFTVSWKKDGISNMGGSVVLKQNGLFVKRYPEIAEMITDHQILTEGHPTYGGMTGRDLKALAVGIATVTGEDYLEYRIGQVERFGKKLASLGIPVLKPFGGHAVYIDMTRFFSDTKMKPEDYGGISFTALLLAGFGHRLCELGNFAFGRLENGRDVFPEVNYVRAAVPRLVYEDADLFSCAEDIAWLYRHRREIPGVEVIYGKEKTLRHFKAKFRFKW